MSTKSFGYIQHQLFNFNHKGMKDLTKLQHFIGCDVSKNTLDFAIYERGKDSRLFEHTWVTNNIEGFQAMRKWLRSFKINLKESVIAMEHTGVYSNALSEWCYKKGIAFVLLHPMDVKNMCSRGRNKNDKADAQFIADHVYTMREKLTPSTPEAPVIKKLRELRNERHLAVRARTSYLNQIKTVSDSATIRRMRKVADTFTAQIKAIESAIKKVIDADASLKKNYDLLTSIPGIGLVNALTTIIATGNFSRFQTARQYAKFSCISPLSNQSGTSVHGGNHVSHAGHNEIKCQLTEGARSAINHDAQLRAYYQRKRTEGKSHGCVMNAVKFKLISRMFAVVHRQTPYVNIERYHG